MGFPFLSEDELDLFNWPLSAKTMAPSEPMAFDVPEAGVDFTFPGMESAQEPAPSAASSAMAPDIFNPGRQNRMAEIDRELAEIQKLQSGRLEKATTSPRMTGDQALVTAIASALPLILGRALAGNRGGAAGAEAGLGIARGTEAGYDAQNKEAQAHALKQYQDGEVERKDLIGQNRELQRQDFSAEDARNTLKIKDTYDDGNREDSQAFLKDLKNDPTYGDLNPKPGGGRGGSQSRLETQALQATYEKVVGKSREQMRALEEIEGMLKNPSSVTYGAVSAKLPRVHGEVGNLAVQEQNKALPSSLYTDAVKAKNYVTGGTKVPLTTAQMGALRTYLAERKAAIAENMSRGDAELKARAASLAPTLAAAGELETVLGSLGAAVKPGREKFTEDDIQRKMKEIAEREAAGQR